MRNLLINLAFIFILVLGGTSDAFSQYNIGIIDILNVNETFSIGIIDILQFDGNRMTDDNIPNISVTIKDENGINLIEHTEIYVESGMQITLPQEEFDKLSVGKYLLTVSVKETIIGTEEVLIE